ncbi:Uncharacterised protein [uncultured Prevotella sp.]|nr:Uncharacterised protein [uncultured Prevotella sp.]
MKFNQIANSKIYIEINIILKEYKQIIIPIIIVFFDILSLYFFIILLNLIDFLLIENIYLFE